MTTSLFAILSALACAFAPETSTPTPSRRQAAEEAPTAVAFAGEAPDDGSGIHVAIGTAAADCNAERPFPGAYTEIGMRAVERVPSTIALPTSIAEALLHSGAGDRRVIDSGVLHLEGYDARGIRGRYVLTADGEIVEGAFDAGWCGEPLPLGRSRAPEPLDGLDLAARAHQVVAVEGYLVVHDGRAVLASELRETLPPRPAGTIVRLDVDPALLDAVVTSWSDRVRGSSGPIVLEGKVEQDGIQVTSVAPTG